MKTQLLFLTFGIASFGLACSSAKITIKESEGKVKKSGFAVRAEWVQPKKKKFDVNLILANETDDKSFVIPLEEIQCGRGTTDGELKHTFFNVGTKNFRLHAHQKKSFKLVCDLGEETAGEFRIKIPHVYDFKGDVKDHSRVALSNIEWKHTDQAQN